MFNFLTDAASTAAGGMGTTIVMLGVMMVLMYFMLIRPENKRKKQAEQMRSALKSGDEVTTIGGVTGTVVDVKEDKFVLETGADRVRIEFAKFALSENHTAAARVADERKKAKEKAAKEKAAKKADK